MIRQYGPANFIYSDSELLFAHGHKRTHGNEKEFRPPGLHILSRECFISLDKQQEIVGLKLEPPLKAQKVILVASVPLTTENWNPLDEGELVVLKNGAII